MPRLVLLWILLAVNAAGAAALDVPKLEARVTDLAGLLAPEQIAALDKKLADLEATDSTQIAVLVIPSLEGEALEDYSMRVASAWRLGQKGRDNGALLLVAMKERKLRIEVGYGLESNLTDARSRRIIQDEILPRFREGEYYGGIDAGVTALIQTVRGVYQPSSRESRTSRKSTGKGPFDWIIILLLPALWLLSAVGALGRGIIGAAVGGFLMYTLAAGSWILMIIGALIGGFLGLLLGRVARAAARSPHRRRWGGPGGFYFGGGGFSGGFSGGGSSGGGFSGGGGSFGGGGASGSW